MMAQARGHLQHQKQQMKYTEGKFTFAKQQQSKLWSLKKL
jgi:hypothetical protein